MLRTGREKMYFIKKKKKSLIFENQIFYKLMKKILFMKIYSSICKLCSVRGKQKLG